MQLINQDKLSKKTKVKQRLLDMILNPLPTYRLLFGSAVSAVNLPVNWRGVTTSVKRLEN